MCQISRKMFQALFLNKVTEKKLNDFTYSGYLDFFF